MLKIENFDSESPRFKNQDRGDNRRGARPMYQPPHRRGSEKEWEVSSPRYNLIWVFFSILNVSNKASFIESLGIMLVYQQSLSYSAYSNRE